MSEFNSKRPYETNTASSEAEKLRAKLGPSFYADKFTKFTWRGQNSWSIYHCFIINNGSDLKWTGAGSITNSYSNSMYETNKTLLGISTKTKSKNLRLGLFAITEEEYRKFLYWMDPMAIDQLMFDYDTDYYYYAKLSSVGDATKYIIGKDEQGKELYYAELDVKFDLQGDGYAYSRNPIEWVGVGKNSGFKVPQDAIISDIRVPFIVKVQISQSLPPSLQIKITNEYDKGEDAKWITLVDLGINEDLGPTSNWSLVYESGNGVLLSANGQLLSYLSRGDNGEKIFSSFVVNKFLLPSNFEDGVENLNNIVIQVATRSGETNYFSTEIYHYNKTLVL